MIGSRKHSYQVQIADLEVRMVVRVKDWDWYDSVKDQYGNAKVGGLTFTKDMIHLLGSTITIQEFGRIYNQSFGNVRYFSVYENNYVWTADMIEEIVTK